MDMDLLFNLQISYFPHMMNANFSHSSSVMGFNNTCLQ